jgi:DEAD/DEAH box helicase domain-containing protein
MLPLQQAYEVQHSILEYLKATFAFNDKEVSKSFYNFINNPTDGMFKGPYVSIKLPFIKQINNDALPFHLISINFKVFVGLQRKIIIHHKAH